MNALQIRKIGLLIRHAEQAQQRTAQQLAHQKRQHDVLQASIEGLSMQWRQIETLLQSQKLSERIVDRAALFMLQQRQAVLRQQQYQLNFERDRLREESETLEAAQRKTRIEMLALQRKQQKFSHWSDLQKRRRMLLRLQREDLEGEDRVVACCMG